MNSPYKNIPIKYSSGFLHSVLISHSDLEIGYPFNSTDVELTLNYALLPLSLHLTAIFADDLIVWLSTFLFYPLGLICFHIQLNLNRWLRSTIRHESILDMVTMHT